MEQASQPKHFRCHCTAFRLSCSQQPKHNTQEESSFSSSPAASCLYPTPHSPLHCSLYPSPFRPSCQCHLSSSLWHSHMQMVKDSSLQFCGCCALLNNCLCKVIQHMSNVAFPPASCCPTSLHNLSASQPERVLQINMHLCMCAEKYAATLTEASSNI